MSYDAYAKALAAVTLTFAGRLGPLLRLFMASDREAQARKDFIKAGAPIVRQARLDTHTAAERFAVQEAKRSGVNLEDWELPTLAEYPDEALGAVLDRVKEADTPTATLVVSRALERHVRAPAREYAQNLADPSPADDDQLFQGDADADFRDILATEEEQKAAEEIVQAKLTETPEERQARYKANWLEEQQRRKELRLARRRGDIPLAGEVPRRRWKYARILTGDDNCGFCVMLSSRGAVYSSAMRAGKLEEIIPINARYRGKPTKIRQKALERIDKIGDKYHDGCDCVVVPVFADSDILDGYQKRLEEIWEKAMELEPKTDNTAVQLNLLRNYLAENPDLALPNLRDGLVLAA